MFLMFWVYSCKIEEGKVMLELEVGSVLYGSLRNAAA